MSTKAWRGAVTHPRSTSRRYLASAAESIYGSVAERGEPAFQAYLVSEGTYRPMRDLDCWVADRHADKRLVESFSVFAEHEQSFWSYDIPGPVWCEPAFGRVFDEKGRVLRRSFKYWRHWPLAPSLAAYAKGRLSRQAVISLPEVVTLREPDGEGNYWHFHDDLLTKLLLVREQGVSAEVPLLVSPVLWRTKYFQEVIRRSGLDKREWVVHDRLVRAGRIIVPVRGSLRADMPAGLQSLLRSEPDPTGKTLLYVPRPRQGLRFVRNERELVACLQHLGFEVLDPGTLDLDAQIESFGSARVVVGAHGAALTNLIHRVGAPTSFVELYPAELLHPHYAWLAREAGFRWSGVVGSETGPDQGFTVDVGQVSRALEELA